MTLPVWLLSMEPPTDRFVIVVQLLQSKEPRHPQTLQAAKRLQFAEFREPKRIERPARIKPPATARPTLPVPKMASCDFPKFLHPFVVVFGHYLRHLAAYSMFHGPNRRIPPRFTPVLVYIDVAIPIGSHRLRIEARIGTSFWTGTEFTHKTRNQSPCVDCWLSQ